MTKFVDYFFAARPMLLLPVWSIYLVCLHYHHQLSGGRFQLDNLVVLAGLSLLAAAANYLNQVYDVETDQANQKVWFIQKNLVTVHDLMKLFIVFSVISIAVATLYSKVTFFIFVQLFALAFAYSAPPLSLKNRAISGLLANSYAFGFLIPLSVMPEISQHNAGLLGWDNPPYFFLAVMGVHIMTTIPDAVGDKTVQKRTIAVIFPRSLAVSLGVASFAGSAYVAYQSGFVPLVVIATVSTVMALASLVIANDSFVQAAAKVPIFLLTILAGWFYPLYLVFVVAIILATRAYYKRRFDIIYPKLT